MYCATCGEPRRGHARFCSNCGAGFATDGADLDDEYASAGATVALRTQDVAAQGEVEPTEPAPSAQEPATTDAVPPVTPAAAPGRHHYYRPGVPAFLAVAAVAALVTAGSLIFARTHGALGYWTVGRAAGFAVYGLLTAAVSLGIFMSLRWRTFQRAWLVAERLHPLLLLTAGAVLITHVAGFVLIGLPAYAALIPFTTGFRTVPISLGILSAYIGVLLLASTYVIRMIGFGVWRLLHYLGFIAWGSALAHGIATGHDSGSGLVIGYYAIGAAVVGVLLTVRLIRHIASLRPPILRSTAARQESRT